MENKICRTCGIEKNSDEFYKNGNTFRSDCKLCNLVKSKKYQQEHKKERKIWLDKNRKQINKNHSEWCKDHPDNRKNSQLKINFGITLEKYNQMLEAQNGLCAICGKEETSIDIRTNNKFALAVDHNHKSNKVRGLLCGSCNKTLGHVKDNIFILEKAIDYLKSRG